MSRRESTWRPWRRAPRLASDPLPVYVELVGRLGAWGLIAVCLLPAGVAQAKTRNDGSSPAPAKIVRLVTHVPSRTLNAVGTGSLKGPHYFSVFKLSHPLSNAGKPELVTMNLAWCPHCAANSWGLAVALSRFGKLTGLRVIDSGTHYCKLTHSPCTLKPAPCFPHTKGLSFLRAHFQSRFLSFRAIVLQDVKGHTVDRMTKADLEAFNPFDPFGQTPAVDVGGVYGLVNSGFSPGALAHKSWAKIANSLSKVHNPTARHIDGVANVFTAAICQATRGHPTRVCNQSGVRGAFKARLKDAPPPPPPPPPPPGGHR